MKIPMKLPQFNRSFLMLGGAILLGGVALALSHKLLHDRMMQIDEEARAAHTMMKVVVASRDVVRGEPIGSDNFSIREVPAEYLHASAVHPEQFEPLVGQRLGAALKRGEPLLDVHLESTNLVFSSTLPKGNRALTTEVDEVNSISGMLRPSDRIDLIVTARASGNNSETTFPLMSNVEVLATGQVTRKRDANSEARTYTTITLSVSPKDADRIVVAKNSGKLTAVLRNPDDSRPNITPALSIDQLMPKIPGRLAVQYIVGGGHS